MKKMPTEKILEIGTATAGHIATAQMLFGRVFNEDASWIKTGLDAGFYQASVVKVGAVERYVIVWHVNDQKSLFVNAVAQLTKDFADFSALVEAFTAIAKKNFCRAIEGLTVRRGIVEKLIEHGFIPAGVCMTKIL
jgi:hypothetical protein